MPYWAKLSVQFMDVKLPKLGEGADSGVVVGIFVKEGDTVANGQSIMELENEKAVASIPSTGAGVVEKVYVKAGDRISIGQKILEPRRWRCTPAAAPAHRSRGSSQPNRRPKKALARPAPELEEADDEPLPESEDEIVNESPVASPSIRRAALEFGIDLRKIRGSESGGRIVAGDVQAYLQRLMRAAGQTRSRQRRGEAAAKPAPVQVDFSQWGSILKQPVSAAVAQGDRAPHVRKSWNTVARVTQFDDLDFTASWANCARNSVRPMKPRASSSRSRRLF